nr:hypothetical protein [uncultured Roseateles sp.]
MHYLILKVKTMQHQQPHSPLVLFPFSKLLSSLAISPKGAGVAPAPSAARTPLPCGEQEIATLDGLTVTESSFDEWAETRV